MRTLAAPRRRPRARAFAALAFAALAAVALAGCGSGAVTLSVREPKHEPEAGPRLDARVWLDESKLPTGKVCSYVGETASFCADADSSICRIWGKKGELCADGFRPALASGLHKLLAKRFEEAPEDETDYVAEFSLAELRHARATPKARPSLRIRWSFVVRDGDGKIALQMVETTVVEDTASRPEDLEDELVLLVERALATIAVGIDEAPALHKSRNARAGAPYRF